MPAFSLSWKGSPHGRPTINPASSASQPANPSTKAAEDVLKRPLSPPLSRLRRAQQALIGRRRRRVVNNRNSRVRVSFAHSTSSSGLRPSGTRTSVQKRKSKVDPRVGSTQWIAGLDTPRRRDAGPIPPVHSRPRVTPAPQDAVYSQDKQKGVSTTHTVRHGRDRGEAEFSLMQVPEAPNQCVPSPKRQPEYAHVGSLDGSSSIELTKFPRKNAKRHASYVARAPPSSRSARTVGYPRQQGETMSSRAIGDNRLGALDPLAEETLSRGLSQQDRLLCLMMPTKSKPHPEPAQQPVQTQDASKSLTRFTKQLERYSTAVHLNGNPGLPQCTPTVSDSPTTLDTVTELLPYHRQFKAAGLAVTSHEQMPRIPESTYQRRPVVDVRRERYAPLARVQIDGSTVTPSEQESVPENSVAPYIPESEDGPYNSQTKQQVSNKRATPVNKALLPWFRKKDAPVASKAHSNRKFSADHIHPSQAMAAEPYLTPSDKLGIIDAYFNSPSPAVSRDQQPESNNTSLSSSSPHRASPLADRALPKEPPIERQPVPRRSLRRHMEDTSQWPTAGVLIHNKSPSPEDHEHDGADITAEIQEKPPVPARDPIPNRSLSSAAGGTVEGPIESRNSPQVPPKGSRSQHSGVGFTRDIEKKPATPPKDFPQARSEPQASNRHHPGQSLCKQWSRVTVLRRKSHAKLSPVPTTITEEPEVATEDLEKMPKDDKGQESDIAPQLPATWSCTVGRSSSFEKALDAVIQKLDDMDERRQYEKKVELEAAVKVASKLGASQELVTNLGSPSGSRSRRQTEDKVGSPAAVPASDTNESGAYLDSNISDRDILLGLKMAICAACDEDLDAWIRDRTGLRLRRFLADLKAFDAVSKDRKPPAPQPLHRQIRRTHNETRRLNAERERRRQSMKSKAWKGPCFGEDG